MVSGEESPERSRSLTGTEPDEASCGGTALSWWDGTTGVMTGVREQYRSGPVPCGRRTVDDGGDPSPPRRNVRRYRAASPDPSRGPFARTVRPSCRPLGAPAIRAEPLQLFSMVDGPCCHTVVTSPKRPKLVEEVGRANSTVDARRRRRHQPYNATLPSSYCTLYRHRSAHRA